MRVYNFAAGPSTLPLEVLQEAKKDLEDYNNSGMSVMELTHRGKVYEPIHNECISLVRELLGVSDNYEILFMTGGASTQFEAVPLNLLNNSKKADYIITGNFAKKAYKAAGKYGDIAVAGNAEDKNYTYIPEFKIRDDADYVHITSNNTIFGVEYKEYPTTKMPLVADMSSDIMSHKVDVDKFGVIYAGAQKNLGPAGVTLVIVRKDLIGNAQPICPIMLNYETFAKNNSLYNTPPTFPIYMMMLNLRYLKKNGGIEAIEKINNEKAQLLYDLIDNSYFYKNPVEKSVRSIMNVPFTTPNPDLDAKCVKEAEENGLFSLKGHRLVGGLRASIYNSMTIEGVKTLVEFLKKFEMENK